MSSFKILKSAQLRVPLGHKREDRIAHRKVFEAFLKTDLFFTRGNKPNNRGISSTSQRKTALEGERSCKCCKTKPETFLVNLFSLRREKESWRGYRQCLKTSPAYRSLKKSVSTSQRCLLSAADHSTSLPLVYSPTSSVGQVYRGDLTANATHLRQELKAVRNTFQVTKKPHKHPRDTKSLVWNVPQGYQLLSSSHSL